MDIPDLSQSLIKPSDVKDGHLRGVNLRGANLASVEWALIDMTGAVLSGAALASANLTGAILDNAKIEKADLNQTRLEGASLQGTIFHKSGLQSAWLVDANCTAADFLDCNISGAIFTNAILNDAVFERASGNGVQFAYSQLQRANLIKANLPEANLSGADLTAANLRRCNLSNSLLIEANVRRANFTEATVSGSNFDRMKDAPRAIGLDTTSAHDSDVRYFERCVRKLPERWVDWEWLRSIGRMRLFAASYAVLLIMPIAFYLLSFYNEKVDVAKAWAEAHADQFPKDKLAKVILTRVHREPAPSNSFDAFFAAVCLAIASTIFTFFCPSRVKEFSRDQWCDQFGRSLIHYWPLAWRWRYARLACATFYAIGAALALWVIVVKAWWVFWFIVENA